MLHRLRMLILRGGSNRNRIRRLCDATVRDPGPVRHVISEAPDGYRQGGKLALLVTFPRGLPSDSPAGRVTSVNDRGAIFAPAPLGDDVKNRGDDENDRQHRTSVSTNGYNSHAEKQRHTREQQKQWCRQKAVKTPTAPRAEQARNPHPDEDSGPGGVAQ